MMLKSGEPCFRCGATLPPQRHTAAAGVCHFCGWDPASAISPEAPRAEHRARYFFDGPNGEVAPLRTVAPLKLTPIPAAVPVWSHVVLVDPDNAMLRLPKLPPKRFFWSPSRRRRLEFARAFRRAEAAAWDHHARNVQHVRCDIRLKRWGIGRARSRTPFVWMGRCEHGYVPFFGDPVVARAVSESPEFLEGT